MRQHDELGISVRKAAALNGVSRTTLSRHLRGRTRRFSKGPEGFLTTEQGDRLVAWALKRAKKGDPLDDRDLRYFANSMLSASGSPHRIRSRSWTQKFLHKHPELAKRKHELISAAKALATSTSMNDLITFAGEIQSLLDALGLKRHQIGMLMRPVPQSSPNIR